MGAYFSSYAGSSNAALFATSNEEECDKEYDYIICGGGTAGCVIASRLTENSDISVLVIEAGESDAKQIFSRLPAGWANLFKSKAEWNFETTPQPNVKDRKLYQPRGKMLGGCSAINAQIYQRCAPSDYDDWEKKGAEGWNWKTMKPYFHKAEHFTPNPDYDIDISERGSGGLWKTSYPRTNDISKALLESAVTVGIPRSPDLNVERHAAGISRFQCTVDAGGTRSSTSAAYIPANVSNRPNLHILTSTIVTRLLLNEANAPDRQIKGVELGQTRDGPRYTAKATKEVIVCLGSFNTPQLLMASGIGSKEDLDKTGVETKIEMNGVGKGLRDHTMAGVSYNAKVGASEQYLTNPVKSLPSLAQWMYNGKGPLSSNGAEIGAFLRSDNIPGATSSIAKGTINASGPDAPDLELINSPVWYMNHGLGGPPNPSGDYFTIFAVPLRPKSTGTVTCKSADMFDYPLIDPGYLSDAKGLDMQVLVEGVKLIARVARIAPLSEYLLESECPKNAEDLTDEQIKEHIRDTVETIYHPMCTCKIGPREKEGVVDTKLRVYGTTNLRICDASIFPDSVSGHPQAAVVACAEKCADIILRDGGLIKA